MAKPFIKWCGGKSQLLPTLLDKLPDMHGSRYFEPFVGGGALFFKLNHTPSTIVDLNFDLINTYKQIRDNPQLLINTLRNGKYVYDETQYYEVRSWDRLAEWPLFSLSTRAARFIYLNKTCFNGLYRVNKKGQFNAPFGAYTEPLICDEENILACSKALQNTEIKCGSYDSILKDVCKGDFVYLDPPYIPLNETSSFTTYTPGGFGKLDHIDLALFCKKLDELGVNFMLSNSYTPLSLNLYKGFNIEIVEASRAVNSKASKRGKIKEIIVTNYI